MSEASVRYVCDEDGSNGDENEHIEGKLPPERRATFRRAQRSRLDLACTEPNLDGGGLHRDQEGGTGLDGSQRGLVRVHVVQRGRKA